MERGKESGRERERVARPVANVRGPWRPSNDQRSRREGIGERKRERERVGWLVVAAKVPG